MSERSSRRRWPVLGLVFALLALPLVLVVWGAASFNALNRSHGVLVSSGETREYLLHVPKSYDPARKTPLVISLHGGGLWGAAQREISQWDRVADREGFIVVYPSGTGLNRYRAWRAGPEAGREKDIRFIQDLLDTLIRGHNIDPSRVYADGISNGAGMAFVLSCALSDRIAAIGMVSSAIFLPWDRCRGAPLVPVIAFHGTADRHTRYHGGVAWMARNRIFPDIPKWIATYARRNECGSNPVESTVAAAVTRVEFTKCAGDAAVVLYRIEGGGHTWPGGGVLPEWFVGNTNRDVDATSRMWEFFREHPRREAPVAGKPLSTGE